MSNSQTAAPVKRNPDRFKRFAPENQAVIPPGTVGDLKVMTTREMIAEQREKLLALKKPTLTQQAMQAYSDPDAAKPDQITARGYAAWCIGRWMHQTGRSSPREVSYLQPGLFAVNDMTVSVKRENGAIVIARET